MAALIDLDSGTVHFLLPLTIIGGGEAANLKIVSDELLIARIMYADNHFIAEALSANQICFINNKKLKKSELAEGDELRIFNNRFRFTFFPPADFKQNSFSREISALNSLYEFGLNLIDDSGKNSVDQLLTAMINATGAEKGFFAVKKGDDFHIISMLNLSGNSEDECKDISSALISRIVKEKKPLILTDFSDDTNLGVSKSLAGLKLNSIIAVPIIKEGIVNAVLYAGSGKVSFLFDEHDLKIITIFASNASLLMDFADLTRILQEENNALKTIAGTAIIYECEPMESLLRQTVRLAASQLPILITGETGTGKELLARMVHDRSPRSSRPFIAVNCAAIPQNLVESELFGHKKGAFTGAVSDASGKIGAASGGTLFLDEIGELPLTQQAKLLRVIESGEYEMVGDSVSRRADVRIVAATNRDLKKKDFRPDLYYRLSAAILNLPPLRERGTDALLIAKSFLTVSPDGVKKRMRFTKEAEAAILRYDWPGNVRELRHRILRAFILSDSGDITAEDLELTKGEESVLQPLLEAKERFAEEYIKKVLLIYEGNKSAAARALEIDPRTIYRYMDNRENA